MTAKPLFEVRLSSGGSSAACLKTIESIVHQVFGDWVLTVAGDSDDVRATERLCLTYYGRSLIADAASAGELVLPLVPGDQITPDCLSELAAAAAREAETPELIYGDQLERFGLNAAPRLFFKPGWSPEFQLAAGYVGRGAVRRDVLDHLDELPPGFSSQDLRGLFSELAVRSATVAVRVEHCVFDLSAHPGGTTDIVAADRGCQQLKRLLDVAGLPGEPYWPTWAQDIGEAVFDVAFPDHGPSVAILIPSRNNWRQLDVCLNSLSKTTYRDYRVIVIDNASDDQSTLDYLAGLTAANVLTVPNRANGFSFAHVNNTAVESVEDKYVMFLNDDVEIIEPTWLSRMVGWLRFPGVASVGAGLWYPNGTLQHTGLLNGRLDGQLPMPAFKLLRGSKIGPRGQARCVRNYAGVTAACMLTPRRLFLDSGGFDDTNFQVAYNDCDYGFRLTAAGWRHVGCPSAQLYHYEGLTRGSGRNLDKVAEEIAFIEKYRGWRDPFDNANLAPDSSGLQPAARAAGCADVSVRGPNVLLCSHNLNFEGAPLVLESVAEGLISGLGAQVAVVSPHEGPLRERFERLGCTVAVVDSSGVFDARDEPALSAASNRVADQFDTFAPDVIVANTLLSFFGLLGASVRDVPYVWIVHESEAGFEHLARHGDLQAHSGRHLMRRAYRNIFVCHATKKIYEKELTNANADVIYNAGDVNVPTGEAAEQARVRVRAELEIGSDALVFLMPGVVCERKSQLDLLVAMSELPNDVLADVHMVILGDRPSGYSDRLHAAVRDAPSKVRERVHILPEVSDAGPYFASADCLAFTSRMESLPLAIMEAMVAGLAIATTPMFGVREQVRDEESALFFEPGDAAGLSAAMTRLARDPDLRVRLGQSARLAVRRFPDKKTMQAAYCRLVREAVLSGGPRDSARRKA